MFLFGKKKKEGEILEEDLPAKKKFKDLKSENKKTRKEPVKPWGRTERVLILVVLGLTVGISAILAAIARGNLVLPSFTLSNGVPEVANFSFDQTFVFEKKTSGNCCEKVILDFKSLTDNLSGTYGFYVIRLDGSRQYGLNEDEIYKAASLIKIPTTVALYRESEAGNLNLNDSYVLRDADKIEGNGSLVNYPAGTAFTFRQLARFALSESDNTAFNIFENYLGDRKIQEAIGALGMKDTSIYDNTTSPKDIALVLKKIKDAEVLNKGDSDEILSYLEDTNFDSWLKKGIPENINIQHKYGRETVTVNDAGIIYAQRPYILVILSKDIDETEADNVFPQLSKAVYDFESKF